MYSAKKSVASHPFPPPLTNADATLPCSAGNKVALIIALSQKQRLPPSYVSAREWRSNSREGNRTRKTAGGEKVKKCERNTL